MNLVSDKASYKEHYGENEMKGKSSRQKLGKLRSSLGRKKWTLST